MIPMLVAGGLSALMSARNAQNKNDQMQKANKAAAEQTRYSAWSGMGQGQINNQYADPMSAAIGGGLQGAAFGSQFNGMGGGTPDATMMAGEAYQQMPSTNPWDNLDFEMKNKRSPNTMMG